MVMAVCAVVMPIEEPPTTLPNPVMSKGVESVSVTVSPAAAAIEELSEIQLATLPGAGVGVFGVGGVGPEFVHQVPNFGVHVDGDQFRVSHVLLPWLCREIILVGDTFD